MSVQTREVNIQVTANIVTRNTYIAREAAEAALSAGGVTSGSPLDSACRMSVELGFKGANRAVKEGLLRLAEEQSLSPCAQQVEGIVRGHLLGALPDIEKQSLDLYREIMERLGLKSTQEDRILQILREFASSGANIAMIIWQMIVALPQP